LSPFAQERNTAGRLHNDRRLDLSQALVEARRCLRCYDAPCTHACPAHIDVPGFISRLAEQNFAGSYEVMVASNPLPAVCGLACPTLDLCEGACVLTRLNQRPIQIGALQYFVAANYQEAERVREAGPAWRVAVIGAGPSGLSCAVELYRLGHKVAVFERALAPGGFLDQVIPHWRLPQADVDHELERVRSLGIEFHFGDEIDSARAAALSQSYDALYVAVGLSQNARPSLPGAELAGVMSALDFLRAAREAMGGDSAPPAVGDCVVVLGGGNVALDAAAAALRLGAGRAIVLYRRTLAEMPAWRSEYIEAASLGVEFRWLSTARAILETEGRASGIEVQPMRLAAPGGDGRRGVEPDLRARPYELPCSTVLLAVGQGLEADVARALGLGITADGTIVAAQGTGQTARPGVFAGGDAVNSGRTVIQAVADGVSAARAMHSWLTEGGR
jgi:NADPH-dependent glutamate synthase beta subunit-like oxidoreductase